MRYIVQAKYGVDFIAIAMFKDYFDALNYRWVKNCIPFPVEIRIWDNELEVEVVTDYVGNKP